MKVEPSVVANDAVPAIDYPLTIMFVSARAAVVVETDLVSATDTVPETTLPLARVQPGGPPNTIVTDAPETGVTLTASPPEATTVDSSCVRDSIAPPSTAGSDVDEEEQPKEGISKAQRATLETRWRKVIDDPCGKGRTADLVALPSNITMYFALAVDTSVSRLRRFVLRKG